MSWKTFDQVAMQTAFKEWALVVDALGRGEQIILLRKGGIHEKGGFKPEHDQFLLFPTNFHSAPESFVPEVRSRLGSLQSSQVQGHVQICYFARVVEVRKLHSLEQTLRLRGQHIWTNQIITNRFDWGKEKAIHALAVRVYRLRKPVTLELLPEYGGCKSWIELNESLDLCDSEPVLTDPEFENKLRLFRGELFPPVILGSASPRRAELLKEAGLEFEVITTSTEELHDHNIPAGSLCELNAERKAEAVARLVPDRLVLGADTLVTRNGKHYGKPENLAEAREMLMELQGRTHQVITGVCLLQHNPSRKRLFHDVTEVTFRTLTARQIDEYLQKVHVLDKAGAYAIQEHGEMIIDRIEGSWSNVVGLPVERLLEVLGAEFASKISGT